jgi:hypothetical protein
MSLTQAKEDLSQIQKCIVEWACGNCTREELSWLQYQTGIDGDAAKSV